MDHEAHILWAIAGASSDVKEASPFMTVPMLLLCLISIILGIYPRPIIDPLMEVIAGILA